MKLKTFLSASILGTAIAANAVAEQPSYNFIDAGYMKLRLGDTDFEPSGYFVQGSFEVHENLFIFGNYADLDDSQDSIDVDAEQYSVGAGYKAAASDTVSIYAALAYVKVEAEAASGALSAQEDDDGYGIELGIRAQETENLEINASISYAKTDEDDGISLSLGTVYYFTSNFGLVAGIGTDTDDNRDYSVGLRLSF